MTHIFDRLFVSAGLPCEELGTVKTRGLLYAGMMFMAGMATAFGIMALVG